MISSSKIEFFKSKELWEENRDLLFEEEENYRTKLVDKYEECIKKVKEEVKDYCSKNGLTLLERSNIIEAKYNNSYLKIRFEFPETFPIERYLFNFTLIENNRRDFIMVIKSDSNKFYVPKRSISIIHPTPQNLSESKKFIATIAEEILSLQEKLNDLTSMNFVYCYYHSNNKNPDTESLKCYKNISPILTSLLN